MNLSATSSEFTIWHHSLLLLASGGAFAVVQVVFRRLKEGLFPAARTGVALAMAMAIYCFGLHMLVEDSLSMPPPISAKDVQDPEKLLALLQAQQAVLHQTVRLMDWALTSLYAVSLGVGFTGIFFLQRMRAVQREQEHFTRQCRESSDADTEPA